MTEAKEKRACDWCGAFFVPNFRSVSEHRYCSVICRSSARIERESGDNPLLALPTPTVGAISELVAGADLLRRGYETFRALSPSCSCDLIALRPGLPPLRIEVRTGTRNLVTGTVTFPRNRATGRGRKPDDLDHYCVVIKGTQEILYEPPLPEPDPITSMSRRTPQRPQRAAERDQTATGSAPLAHAEGAAACAPENPSGGRPS